MTCRSTTRARSTALPSSGPSRTKLQASSGYRCLELELGLGLALRTSSDSDIRPPHRTTLIPYAYMLPGSTLIRPLPCLLPYYGWRPRRRMHAQTCERLTDRLTIYRLLLRTYHLLIPSCPCGVPGGHAAAWLPSLPPCLFPFLLLLDVTHRSAFRFPAYMHTYIQLFTRCTYTAYLVRMFRSGSCFLLLGNR